MFVSIKHYCLERDCSFRAPLSDSSLPAGRGCDLCHIKKIKSRDRKSCLFQTF